MIHLSIIITWIILTIAFLGMGSYIIQIFSIKRMNMETLLSSLCLGWAALIIILQIWHLFLPVDIAAVVCFLIIGFTGCIVHKHYFDHIKLILGTNKGKLALLFVILFAIWLSNQVMRENNLYDSGLYHLGMIQWISTYPIVPGLGNLHGRFAFNNSFFLYLSFLDTGHWKHFSAHLGNGLLLLILSFYLCLSFFKIFQDRITKGGFIFILLLTYPILYRCTDICATTSTDLPIFIFTIIIAYYLFQIIFNKKDDNLLQFHVFMVIFLSLICVTIKLSFIAFGFTASLISAIICIRKMLIRKDLNQLKKMTVLIFASTLITIFPWMIRGIYLSGYLVYPSTFGAFDVEWQISHDKVVKEGQWVKSWARQPRIDPDIVLVDWQWLKPWSKRMMKKAYVMTTIFLIVIGFILTFSKSTCRKERLLYFLWFLPGIVSLIFWFFTAPDPRFAMGSFWVLAAGALTSSIKCWEFDNKTQFAKTVVTISTLIIIRAIIMGDFNSDITPGKTAQVKNYETKFGLVVSIPIEGDQCWDSPIPCTYAPDPLLKLRVNGHIEKGFMVPGNY